MRTIRPSQLANELRANARANIPTMIWGPPGIGKSQIAYQIAEDLNAKLFELRANLSADCLNAMNSPAGPSPMIDATP